jgi:hypothetical protein
MKIIFLTPRIDTTPYFWLIDMGTRKLGLHKSNGWCMELPDGRLIFFDSEEKCVPLGPILETDEQTFNEFLEKIVASNPDYSESIKKFPKELLLKHIFHTSVTGYWPERALAWLASDRDLCPLFRDELEIFIKNKKMPQGARQKAKKLIKSISQA